MNEQTKQPVIDKATGQPIPNPNKGHIVEKKMDMTLVMKKMRMMKTGKNSLWLLDIKLNEGCRNGPLFIFRTF